MKDYFVRRGDNEIHLNFFFCSDWEGEIKSMELQEFKWIKLSEISQYNMLTSNKKIISHLFTLF